MFFIHFWSFLSQSDCCCSPVTVHSAAWYWKEIRFSMAYETRFTCKIISEFLILMFCLFNFNWSFEKMWLLPKRTMRAQQCQRWAPSPYSVKVLDQGSFCLKYARSPHGWVPFRCCSFLLQSKDIQVGLTGDSKLMWIQVWVTGSVNLILVMQSVRSVPCAG